MKGILHKTESGWIVIYDQILGEGIIKRNQNSLPLHPEYQTILPLDLDLEGNEVEFDWCVIVEHDTGKGKEYAKLITPKQSTTPSQTFIMKNKDGVFYELPTKEDTKQTAVEWLIEQLTPSISLQQKHIDNYKAIANKMFEQQIIDAAERWKGTKFAEKYYNETYAKISTPMLDRLKAHLDSITPEQFDKEIDDIIKNDDSVQMLCEDCGMEECECGLTPDEQIIKDLHNDRKSHAVDFAKWIAKEWMSIWVVDRWLWEWQPERTPETIHMHLKYYTEEELYELYLEQA